MRKFRIPVSWEVNAVQEIEAPDLETAIAIAEVDETLDLPEKVDFIEGSYKVDTKLIKDVIESVGLDNLANNDILNI
tara:strand:+ start:185 stop:415 length:231 start_codon:yes stop_codon:yes gene_type:complete